MPKLVAFLLLIECNGRTNPCQTKVMFKDRFQQAQNLKFWIQVHDALNATIDTLNAWSGVELD